RSRPVAEPRTSCLPAWRLASFSDFENRIICALIPGRREVASPESLTTGRGLWIPGSPPSVAPRNDQAEHMIGFVESLYLVVTPLRRRRRHGPATSRPGRG